MENHAKPVLVFTTVSPHERSRSEVCERYGARALSIRDPPPDGLDWIGITDADETMVWLPRAKVLIPGDRLLGDGQGGVRMCPASWLDHLPGMDTDQLRKSLEVLLELPVEIVLVSHGEPVLRNGRAAVAAALAR